jgi:hypothetical protein
MSVRRSDLDACREAARLARTWLALAGERASPFDPRIARTFGLCADRVGALLDRLDLHDPDHWRGDAPDD